MEAQKQRNREFKSILLPECYRRLNSDTLLQMLLYLLWL